MPAGSPLNNFLGDSQKNSLEIQDKDDKRQQPWREFVDVQHTAEKSQVLGDHIRLLGQRINAHMG